jgi:hypothetical protein
MSTSEWRVTCVFIYCLSPSLFVADSVSVFYSIHYPSSSIILIGLCKLPCFLKVDNTPVSFQFPAEAKHRSQYIDSRWAQVDGEKACFLTDEFACKLPHGSRLEISLVTMETRAAQPLHTGDRSV